MPHLYKSVALTDSVVLFIKPSEERTNGYNWYGSQKFQKLRKLFIRCSSFLSYCYSSATKGGGRWCKQVLCDQALAKVNKKESLSKAEPFYGQPPLVANLGVRKSRREACGQERPKSPFDKCLVTQPQMPSLVPTDQDLPKPIIQTEKEEKTPKHTASSEISTVAIVLRSSKDLNENHQTWGTLIFFFRI